MSHEQRDKQSLTTIKGYEAVNTTDTGASSTSTRMAIDLTLLQDFSAAVARKEYHFRFTLVVGQGEWMVGDPCGSNLCLRQFCATKGRSTSCEDLSWLVHWVLSPGNYPSFDMLQGYATFI